MKFFKKLYYLWGWLYFQEHRITILFISLFLTSSGLIPFRHSGWPIRTISFMVWMLLSAFLIYMSYYSSKSLGNKKVVIEKAKDISEQRPDLSIMIMAMIGWTMRHNESESLAIWVHSYQTHKLWKKRIDELKQELSDAEQNALFCEGVMRDYEKMLQQR